MTDRYQDNRNLGNNYYEQNIKEVYINSVQGD